MKRPGPAAPPAADGRKCSSRQGRGIGEHDPARTDLGRGLDGQNIAQLHGQRLTILPPLAEPAVGYGHEKTAIVAAVYIVWSCRSVARSYRK